MDMYKNEAYYLLKKLIPRQLQLSIRKFIVQWKLSKYGDIWPIDESAAKPPEGWSGWPEGKKFAFVITHDVESAKGLKKCRQLAEIDKRFGLRSSFNFVAEDYEVPPELRQYLPTKDLRWAFMDCTMTRIYSDLKRSSKNRHSKSIFI